jgi:hypothetical protein
MRAIANEKRATACKRVHKLFKNEPGSVYLNHKQMFPFDLK